MKFLPDQVITDLGYLAVRDFVEINGFPYLCVARHPIKSAREFRKLFDDSTWTVEESILTLDDTKMDGFQIIRVDDRYYRNWQVSFNGNVGKPEDIRLI